jgi:hypothetical protein
MPPVLGEDERVIRWRRCQVDSVFGYLIRYVIWFIIKYLLIVMHAVTMIGKPDSLVPGRFFSTRFHTVPFHAERLSANVAPRAFP